MVMSDFRGIYFGYAEPMESGSSVVKLDCYLKGCEFKSQNYQAATARLLNIFLNTVVLKR